MKHLLSCLLIMFGLVQQIVSAQNRPPLAEVFDVNEMTFNGKVKRFFSFSEFEKYFGTSDSIHLLVDVQPCSYIFENDDATKDLKDKYLYKDGSRFENSGDKVAVDEFRFTGRNYIRYKNVKLNRFTKLRKLKKLFPNAVHQIAEIEVQGEGRLQIIQLREDADNFSDGDINVFLKNGRLYYMHWWFPC